MMIKGIVSAIYYKDKKIAVILPEFNNVVTKPLPVYAESISDFKVNDFVIVNVFNDDFNDGIVLKEQAEGSGQATISSITNLELDAICTM